MKQLQRVILGSQSPQREALLETIIAADKIAICPPLDSNEPGFSGINHFSEIQDQLTQIAIEKNRDVLAQQTQNDWDVIMTADTVIVTGNDDDCLVLGKPPKEDWQQTVRNWFLNQYSGKTHRASTAVCFRFADGEQLTTLTTSQIHFHPVNTQLLEWYLQTEEPIGKAGGYGIQSAGSLFVDHIDGSLSNIIGLPLEEIWRVLSSRGLFRN